MRETDKYPCACVSQRKGRIFHTISNAASFLLFFSYSTWLGLALHPETDFPTYPFKFFKLQILSRNTPELQKNGRTPDIDAFQQWKSWSGFAAFLLCYTFDYQSNHFKTPQTFSVIPDYIVHDVRASKIIDKRILWYLELLRFGGSKIVKCSVGWSVETICAFCGQWHCALRVCTSPFYWLLSQGNDLKIEYMWRLESLPARAFTKRVCFDL